MPALLLAGCGFRLRGVPQFAFHSLYIVAPAGSLLALELRRTLQAAGGGSLVVITDPAMLPKAEAVFELLSEQQERSVVGLNASGQARELELAAAGVELGKTYPRPIVDHAEARERTLLRYAVVKKPGATPK